MHDIPMVPRIFPPSNVNISGENLVQGIPKMEYSTACQFVSLTFKEVSNIIAMSNCKNNTTISQSTELEGLQKKYDEIVKKNNETEQENKDLKKQVEVRKAGSIILTFKEATAEKNKLESKLHESLKEFARKNEEIIGLSKKLKEITEKYEDKVKNETELNLMLQTKDDKSKRVEEESISFVHTNSNIFYEDYDKYKYLIGEKYSEDLLVKKSDCKANVKLDNDSDTNHKNNIVSSDQ